MWYAPALATLVLMLSACALPPASGVGSDPSPTPTPSASAATPIPQAIRVYDFGHVTHLDPRDQLFDRLAAAAGAVLANRFEEEATSSEHYVRNVKAGAGFGDASQTALELVYASPSARVGSEGAYTHVFSAFGDVRPNPLSPPDYTTEAIVGTDGRYDRLLSTKAGREAERLKQVLTLVVLRPAPGKGLWPNPSDENRVNRVGGDFLQALGHSRTFRRDRWLSGEYEAVARMHLAPELAQPRAVGAAVAGGLDRDRGHRLGGPRRQGTRQPCHAHDGTHRERSSVRPRPPARAARVTARGAGMEDNRNQTVSQAGTAAPRLTFRVVPE